ncbi:MAG: hypothetical protein GY851_20465, partial [bacterium]|nr:hypothetical protein [bacterium]
MRVRSSTVLLGFLICRILLGTSTASADPIAGDVDLSGSVDAIDVQLVINDALGIDVAFTCDVDYSGSTNAVDVQLVINAALTINIDMDEDGLCDGAEENLGTEADVFDTDRDGTGDGQEMLDGTDPLVSDAGVPPDPEDVAPEIDPTVATDMHTAVSFLYDGEDPVQTGVTPGAIHPVRVAVVRGKVVTDAGEALAGVGVTIEGQAELGMTATRADGEYDLAVNGGGTLIVNYTMAGRLPARRKVDVPWQGFVCVPEVVLIPLDSEVTVIDFSDPIEVARGTMQTDGDGERQATLLFPQGAKASLVLPNGRKQGVDELSVRLTEYTVGENGPERMPADLPPTSFYTYAVELSADEALKAGAKTVEFSEPVYFYVENFLGFPAGIAAPVGCYDEDAGTWMPSPDGRVMDVVGVTGGMVDLDADGDGTPDEDAALDALGITAAEREQLAGLYTTGESLIRAPIPHFTAYDINYGIVTLSEEEAIAPDTPEPSVSDGNDIVDPCVLGGWGSIESQNQVLREAVGVVGTPFRLHYASNRMPGFEAARTLTIPLTGPAPPSILVRVELEITAGGRQFTETFSNAPNQTYTFVWDGLDAYGRKVQGRQQASVRIGYVYDAFYALPPEMAASFGYPSGVRVPGDIPAREPITRWRARAMNIGQWNAGHLGLGGWSLSVHHVYDPQGRTLYLGDARQRRADNMNTVITTVAGGGDGPVGSGDGGPATEANI